MTAFAFSFKTWIDERSGDRPSKTVCSEDGDSKWILFDFNHPAFVRSLCIAFLFLLPRTRQLTARLSELAIALPAIILGMVAVSIGHCFWKHYFLMGTTRLVLAGIIGAEAVSRYLSGRGRHISLGALIASSALFFLVAKTPTRAMLTPWNLPDER